MIEGNTNYFFAGGKRIKKIEKYNDDYNLAFQKEYEYKTDEEMQNVLGNDGKPLALGLSDH